jgi:rhamnogalacturonyl hydrolase YesR
LGALAAGPRECATRNQRDRLLHLWHGLGLSSGLLDKSYAPVVQRGWKALESAIQPDGRLGWVQQVSDRPDRVEAQDTQFYGVGAFLLAATQVSKLQRSGILN